jgi:hypothetical protein
MPIHATYLSGHRLVLSVWQGSVSLSDWISFVEKVTKQPKYKKAESLLIVIQSADIQLSLAEIQANAQGLNVKIAAVADFPREKVLRLEQAAQDAGLTAIVYGDLHSACTWLNLSLPDANLAIRRALRKA